MEHLDRALSENLRILAQVLHEICQRNSRQEACPVPMSRNQLYILRMLASAGELPIGEIARTLDISNAAASKNIDRLQEGGFVERRSHPQDRRSHDVLLLEAGRKVAAAYDLILDKKQRALMANFTVEEKAVLLDLVRRIIRCTLADERNTDRICRQCGGRCGDDCVVGNARGSSAPFRTT